MSEIWLGKFLRPLDAAPPLMGVRDRVSSCSCAGPLECRPPHLRQAGCRPRYCCRCRAGLRCLHDAMPPSELELSPRTPLRSLLGGIGRRQSFEVPQLHGYRVGRTLGKGKFGKVRTAVDKETGEVVAIKHITKPQGKAELAAMAREVQLMRSVDHPRLVKLHKVVDTERVLYLVLEQLHGGEVCPRCTPGCSTAYVSHAANPAHLRSLTAWSSVGRTPRGAPLW